MVLWTPWKASAGDQVHTLSMGQVPLKPSSLLGEVELGLEAIVLLESREEGHSQVVRIRPPTPSPPQPTGHPLHRRRSSRKHSRPSSIHKGNGNERESAAAEDEEPHGRCGDDRPDSPLLLEMVSSWKLLFRFYAA